MSEASAVLHIHTGDDTQQEISAELLCQFVESLQRLACLTGAACTGRGNRKRIFNTAEFTEEYQVVCALPKAGSYVLPFKIRNNAHPLGNESKKVFSSLMAALVGISVGNIGNTILKELSSENRARFAREVARLAQSENSSYRVSIDSNEDAVREGVPAVFEFTKNLSDNAKRVLATPSEEIPEEVMSVIGELISINFEMNTLTVRNYSTHKEIKCVYRPEVVDQIVQNRSGGVQVTGKFTLDDDGNPKSLSDVSLIAPVDLSRIVVPRFAVDGRAVAVREGIDVSIVPQLDEETRQMFVAIWEDIGIEAFANTREELVEAIREQLVVNWYEYAKAEDETLTETAIQLKKNLLDRYAEEVG